MIFEARDGCCEAASAPIPELGSGLAAGPPRGSVTRRGCEGGGGGRTGGGGGRPPRPATWQTDVIDRGVLLGAGKGRREAAFPPGQQRSTRGGGPMGSAPCSLTMRRLVTHESTGFWGELAAGGDVGWGWPGDPGFTTPAQRRGGFLLLLGKGLPGGCVRGEWHSPKQRSFTILVPPGGTGVCQCTASMRTLTDRSESVIPPWRAASRDAAGGGGGMVGRPAGAAAAGRLRGSHRRGQAPKGVGGMPRRRQDSGVEGCDKSGGAAPRAMIPECPSNPGN